MRDFPIRIIDKKGIVPLLSFSISEMRFSCFTVYKRIPAFKLCTQRTYYKVYIYIYAVYMNEPCK